MFSIRQGTRREPLLLPLLSPLLNGHVTFGHNPALLRIVSHAVRPYRCRPVLEHRSVCFPLPESACNESLSNLLSEFRESHAAIFEGPGQGRPISILFLDCFLDQVVEHILAGMQYATGDLAADDSPSQKR